MSLRSPPAPAAAAVLLLLATTVAPRAARAQGPNLQAAVAAIEVTAGAQVPPVNAPLWGDPRLQIPDHQIPVPAPDPGGVTLYVAPERENGGRSDPNVYAAADHDGTTPARPVPVARAVETAPPGSVIVFRGGTYRGVGNVAINKKLSLQNFPGEKPWLLGSVAVDSAGFAPAGEGFPEHTVVCDWTGDLGTDPSAQIIDKRPQFDQSKNAVANRLNLLFVDGRMLREVAPFSWDYTDRGARGKQAGTRPAQEQLTPPEEQRSPNGTFWVDAENRRLYVNVGGPLAGRKVEAAAFKEALFLDRQADGGTIRGLGVACYGGEGVRSFLGVPAEVASCASVWNGLAGFNINASNSAAIFRHNLFACNGMVGLGLSHSRRGTLVENNRFEFNNVKQYAMDWAAAGVKITNTHDLLGRGNLVEGNYATGFWMDVDVLRPRVYDNVARYNGSIGIFFEISDVATIAYNLAYGNSYAGIMVANSNRAAIWNNTIVRNGTNLVLKNSHRKNDDKHQRTVGGTPFGEFFSTANNTFGNNLVVDLRPGRTNPMFNAVTAGANRPLSAVMVTASDHNAFYRTNVDAAQRPPTLDWTWGLDPVTKKPDSAVYATVDEFRRDPRYALNRSRHEARSLFGEGPQPRLFVGDNGGRAPDLRPASGSPVLGKGGPQPDDVRAIARELGRPTAPPNIGAF